MNYVLSICVGTERMPLPYLEEAMSNVINAITDSTMIHKHTKFELSKDGFPRTTLPEGMELISSTWDSFQTTEQDDYFVTTEDVDGFSTAAMYGESPLSPPLSSDAQTVRNFRRDSIHYTLPVRPLTALLVVGIIIFYVYIFLRCKYRKKTQPYNRIRAEDEMSSDTDSIFILECDVDLGAPINE